VGFKFQAVSNTYYGWLRVKAPIGGGIALVTNEAGVFGAVAPKGEILGAGETTITPTPEPSVAALGGLALLACGAAGVREQRRRWLAAAKTN
jgi:hypothetical protein